MSGELNPSFLEQGTNNEKKARVNSSGELLIDKTGLATSDKQDALLTELQNKADLTETQPISAVTLPLPDNAATESTLSNLDNNITNAMSWGWNVKDAGQSMINPATSDNQTNGTQKTQITTALINFVFDSVYLTEPDTVTEVYTYKLSGDTVATITIIYTDATKETLVSCIRS